MIKKAKCISEYDKWLNNLWPLYFYESEGIASSIPLWKVGQYYRLASVSDSFTLLPLESIQGIPNFIGYGLGTFENVSPDITGDRVLVPKKCCYVKAQVFSDYVGKLSKHTQAMYRKHSSSFEVTPYSMGSLTQEEISEVLYWGLERFPATHKFFYKELRFALSDGHTKGTLGVKYHIDLFKVEGKLKAISYSKEHSEYWDDLGCFYEPHTKYSPGMYSMLCTMQKAFAKGKDYCCGEILSSSSYKNKVVADNELLDKILFNIEPKTNSLVDYDIFL
jgi:hypothetical protein